MYLRLSTWGVITALLLSLTACSGQTEDEPQGDPTGTTRLTLANGSVALVGPEREGESMAALITGEVVDIQGECVGLSTGDSKHVLVFDHGTTLTAGGEALETPDGVELRVGDSIEGEGGFFPLEGLAPRPGWEQEFPACFDAGSIANVSSVKIVK